MYPDFIVVRSVGRKLVVDLVDPHSLELADAPDKASGLAQYAAEPSHVFGRIVLIVVDGDNMLSLDLTDEVTRDRVTGG